MEWTMPYTGALREQVHAILGRDMLPEQVELLQTYLTILEKWNRTYNLTALDVRSDPFARHILSCLSFIPLLSGERGAEAIRSVIVDIGSGNGILGVMLAIFLPEIRSNPGLPRIYLVDSSKKKTVFLKYLISNLSVGAQLSVLHVRAEELAQNLPGPCHYVVSKAFCSLSQGARYAQPVLAPNGSYLMVKGDSAASDLLEYSNQPIAQFYSKPVILPIHDAGSIIQITRNRLESG